MVIDSPLIQWIDQGISEILLCNLLIGIINEKIPERISQGTIDFFESLQDLAVGNRRVPVLGPLLFSLQIALS